MVGASRSQCGRINGKRLIVSWEKMKKLMKASDSFL